MLLKSFDAVVIGAGIIGAATAYYLSMEGLKVLVVDRSTPASGTSGACDGVISLHSKTPGLKIDMAREGIRLYRQLSLHTDLDLESAAWSGQGKTDPQPAGTGEHRNILGPVISSRR